MNYLNVKTRGNASPQGKPRVYFTCNQSDFDKTFEKISNDILENQDCAIYYTPDMNFEIPEEYKSVDLNQMNLFVVPVSFELLRSKNRAMDSDVPFAVEKHIPILPIMIEGGLDLFYSEKFGQLQYLSLYGGDLTAISYEEKLKKYLSSVLMNDKTAERVRAAFDAYIFLSYRKKDRKYANELMRLIHSNPLCRDIAIWYDEFLVPGESFSESIQIMLEKSKVFALLVTPNLVNEDNYVLSVEYPAAKKVDKVIIPVEMENTDRTKLKELFTGLPDPLKVSADPSLLGAITDALSEIALKENDSDPTHNFLIGLAYLDGIDVEIDREKAVELITSAAQANLLEAMQKLESMYRDGYGVKADWVKAHFWCCAIADYYTDNFPEDNSDRISALFSLAASYHRIGDTQNSLKISKDLYQILLKLDGEDYIDTITARANIAVLYNDLGDSKNSLTILEKIYAYCVEHFGENDPSSINALSEIGSAYYTLGNYEKALEMLEKAYLRLCEVKGEKYANTTSLPNNISICYAALGNAQKALELSKKQYDFLCKTFGEKHPSSVFGLVAIAHAYYIGGDYSKALDIIQKECDLYIELLGKNNALTLKSLGYLAALLSKTGSNEQAIEIFTEIYDIQYKLLGPAHPDTKITENNLRECRLQRRT